jgi:hypothetical protein
MLSGRPKDFPDDFGRSEVIGGHAEYDQLELPDDRSLRREGRQKFRVTLPLDLARSSSSGCVQTYGMISRASVSRIM